MHDDQVRLNAQLLQLGDAVFDVPEMLRIKPGVIKMITFRSAHILDKILFCQYGGIHGSSLVRIRTWFSQVVVVMLREHAEPDLVECTFL